MMDLTIDTKMSVLLTIFPTMLAALVDSSVISEFIGPTEHRKRIIFNVICVLGGTLGFFWLCNWTNEGVVISVLVTGISSLLVVPILKLGFTQYASWLHSLTASTLINTLISGFIVLASSVYSPIVALLQ